ncbi:hypothetical protein ACRE_090290 [Hapsidospora chrysogenum ATCC 11550]|uniref:Heterokaryon incompatibility domain-containing protein n=1 Tax=Hapsidospora chrysogenum (strain ATCC 11550 / CBS 779.69 / DSM 880 / IAM 14645 / JCM 23072 / IMI 49137) TaxID=857340 RepID=A0A086ST77_HAPC1|nr:hypothetical protein ACRE_090290 [Hapsidospora chrysogenum ATCC 11550]
MGDDKDGSLLQLSQQHRASIVSQLVNISSEGNQKEHTKFLAFVKRLQCLHLVGSELRRQTINAYEGRYVALSYTWNPSKYESPEFGSYAVENWDDEFTNPSPVRNCALDRVLQYMRYTEIRLLWIDRHCIRQETCDIDDCARHSRCIEKRDAIQAMDLVYQLSEHPVALLGRPVKNGAELHLLNQVLSGNLVHGDREFRLSTATNVHLARKALLILSEIIQDSWWCRAWTFQENYRAGTKMQLLIRHDLSLEPQKRRYSVFGEIPGELCIPSITFSTQATRLCLALRRLAELPRLDTKRVEGVLRAAGRYKLMVHGSSPMTPIVIADIEARGLSKPWDRLAIVANCCQYSLRLDGGALSRRGRSPSLSVLAMCLLNGEILDNSNNMATANKLKTSEFLDRFIFRGFRAPEDDTRQLTFNKGCRLTNVELTAAGIATRGHLWKLGRVINTARFRRQLPWIDEPRGRLTLGERKRLLQLVFCLSDSGYRLLADRIDEYLAIDAVNANEDYRSFTEMYLHRMATELAAAICAGRQLRLGSISDGSQRPAPYRAIFIWSDHADDGSVPPAGFAFTSAWQREVGSQKHDANDIDRHVSLEVVNGTLKSRGVPQLRVRRWLLGMCFFDGCPRIEVTFPWPRALEGIEP